MERNEIILAIKNLILDNGYFIYGKTDLPLPLNKDIANIKQYVTTIYDDRVMLVDTIETQHISNNYIGFEKLSTIALKQILLDMCKHYKLETPIFSDYQIDFTKLFNETKLNTNQDYTLRRMLFYVSNGGLKNYLNENYNRLKQDYSKWFQTTYLDVILNEIDEMTFLNKLVDVNPKLYYQECNMYNFTMLFKENLTQYFDNFDSGFRGSIQKVHRFDDETIIETYVNRDKQINFYNVKYRSTCFADLTNAYIHGKAPNFANAIMTLIKTES
jgi:hypothetical protein